MSMKPGTDVSVIIVAGGSGTRMGSDIPKQFLLLGGRRVLMHTIERFAFVLREADIIVVLPEKEIACWRSLCEEYCFQVSCRIVAGGSTRFESVKKGLEIVEPGCKWIAVHDGVRPLVSENLILRCIKEVTEYGAVIPVVEVTDSLREIDGESSRIVPRERYRQVQTPQIFDAEILKKAYGCPYKESFTDDASVVESIGVPIHLTLGERLNIKITTPEDLKLVKLLI